MKHNRMLAVATIDLPGDIYAKTSLIAFGTDYQAFRAGQPFAVVLMQNGPTGLECVTHRYPSRMKARAAFNAYARAMTTAILGAGA